MKLKILKKATTILALVTIVTLSLFNIFPTSALNSNAKEIEVGEIVTMRGKYDKYFQNEDGSVTVATYNDPIHYKNEKGEWIDIDNTLIEDTESIESINQSIESNKRYINKDNPFKVSFSSKANSNELVSIEINGYKISWGLDNSIDTDSFVKNSIDEVKASNVMELDKYASEITYKKTFPNSDLKYSLSFNSLKEEIVLNEVPIYEDITFNVIVNNLIAKVQENNDIILYDVNDNTKEIFKISAPFMYDSAEKASYNENIKVILEETEQGYKITHKLDTEWLKDESRVYPVIVDPTVTSSQDQTNIEDSYVNSWSPNTNYVMSDKLILGQSSGSNRTFIKITNMPSLPSGVVITDARLIANLFSGTYSWGALEIYELRSAWDSYTVTWNNHSSISKSYLHNGITPTYVSPYYKYNINVTSTVQKWYAGTLANWGFMLKYQDEAYNDYNWLYSSDSGISSVYRPAIVITYIDPIPTYTSLSVGTNYYNFFLGENINTTFSAILAYNHYSDMGIISHLDTTPTLNGLKGSHSNGIPFLKSDILFFSGHGKSAFMSWNYLGYGGAYATGITARDSDWTANVIYPVALEPNTPVSHTFVGLGQYAGSQTKLAIFGGCETAAAPLTSLGFNYNLVDFAINKGIKSAIGWTSEIGSESQQDWLEYFNLALSAGNTIESSITYANGYTYADNRVRTNIVPRGDISISFPSALSSNSMQIKNQYIINKEIIAKNDLSFDEKVKQEVETFIKENIDKSFNSNDYRIEVGDNGLYIYTLYVNNIKTNLGYTVFIENNKITMLVDNTLDVNVNDIKIKLSSINKEVFSSSKLASIKNKVFNDMKKAKDSFYKTDNEFIYFDGKTNKLSYGLWVLNTKNINGIDAHAINEYYEELLQL